jgi:hypothetical protein
VKFGNTRFVQVTPPVSLAAYTSGDVVGGIMTVGPLGSAFGRGVLKHVSITDAANQKPALTLLFFRATPAGGTYDDAAAPAWDADDFAKFVGKVEITADEWTTCGGDAFATKECSIALRGDDDDRTVYCVAVTTSTPDFAAADDLRFGFGLLLD